MVVSVVVVQFPYFLDAFFSLYLSRTLSSWAVAGKRGNVMTGLAGLE